MLVRMPARIGRRPPGWEMSFPPVRVRCRWRVRGLSASLDRPPVPSSKAQSGPSPTMGHRVRLRGRAGQVRHFRSSVNPRRVSPDPVTRRLDPPAPARGGGEWHRAPSPVRGVSCSSWVLPRRPGPIRPGRTVPRRQRARGHRWLRWTRLTQACRPWPLQPGCRSIHSAHQLRWPRRFRWRRQFRQFRQFRRRGGP